MLYSLSDYLQGVWGPFRLFSSYSFLMALGAFCAALLVVFLLPRFFPRMPHDHGKSILGKDGMVSAGKATGGGLWITLLTLPVLFLVVPFYGVRIISAPWDLCAIAFLYLAMICGYCDDRSEVAWGQLKKGLLDVIVAVGVTVSIYAGLVCGTGDWYGVGMWFPFVKGLVHVPWYVYLPCASFFLWIVMNATNCSDGVDGLAGTLTVMALVGLSAMLYLVIGNMPTAEYFLIPVGGTAARCAARWSVVTVTFVGAFSGYLWWNAEPSKVQMGDAGSRFLGLLAGAGALVTGNPFLILAFMPVVLVNGGAGLVKLVLLRGLGKTGADIRPPSKLTDEERKRQNVFVKALQAVRCPLHDHCKKNLKWSNAQVLMRFVILQAFLVPVILLILVKIR